MAARGDRQRFGHLDAEGLDDRVHETAPFKLGKGGTMRWARNLKVGGKRTIVHDVPGYADKGGAFNETRWL